jgi:excisionase family DNA binding protein
MQVDADHGPRNRTTPSSNPARIAVSPGEAAELLGVSRDFFDEHIRPDLRVIRRGRLILIRVQELERWAEENATRTFEDGGLRR